MIDIHTHILPEMDDGSGNVEESMKMLSMLSEQGVDTVVATPHFYIDRMDPLEFLKSRSESFEKLKKSLPELKGRPKLAIGAEVQFYPELASLDGIEEFCIGGTNYILIEMPFSPWTGYTYQALNHLSMSRRIIPIIAHLERYFDFMNEKEIIFKLKEAGALIQVNATFIVDRATRRKALNLIKQDAVSFLGTDAHNITSRPPEMGLGLDIIRKKLGESGFDVLRYREEKIKNGLVVF